MIAPFGTSLHVSGRDEAALEAAIAPTARGAATWTRSQSVTDVFIDLMGQARDNFRRLFGRPIRTASDGFWRRTYAMLVKEFISSGATGVVCHDRDDPAGAASAVRHAINTNRAYLPTAVLLQRRAISAARCCARWKTPSISRSPISFTMRPSSTACSQPAASRCSQSRSGHFERAVRRNDRPALLVAADATDPVASGSRSARSGQVVATALAHDRLVPETSPMPFEVRSCARYNPAGATNSAIAGSRRHHPHHDHADLHRALGDARVERGLPESLLSMPITPIEIARQDHSTSWSALSRRR
jgi:ABC-2 type transport system permease protein